MDMNKAVVLYIGESEMPVKKKGFSEISEVF
jgi:hypothetical protein